MNKFGLHTKSSIVLIVPNEIVLENKNDIMYRETILDDIESNIYALPGNFLKVKFFKENIGVSMLKAFMEENNYEADILYMNELRNVYIEVIDEIVRVNPPIVGLSIMYNLHLFNSLQIVRDLRYKGYEGKIILGGPCATLLYKEILKVVPLIDGICMGEGEYTILNIVNCVLNNKPLEVRGFSYVKDGVIVSSCPEIAKDLDDLPFANRDYLKYFKGKMGKLFILCAFYTSRGCSGNCTYCSAPALKAVNDTPWRCRSVDNIIEEIKYLVNEFGIEYLDIIDENFFGYGVNSYKRLKEFSEKIIESDLKITFRGEMRTDINIDSDLLGQLKKAGLHDILLGIESGVQSVLNRWRKGTKIKKTGELIKLIKSMDFNLVPALIMMDPYMTKQEMIESFAFIKETKIYECENPLYMFNELIVFPGTEIANQLLEDGITQKKDYAYSMDNNYSDNQIYELCFDMTFYNYNIQDNDVSAFWKALKQSVNILTYLVDYRAPSVLKLIYNKFSSVVSEVKEELLQFIKRYRLWMKNLPEMTMGLLEISSSHLSLDIFDVDSYISDISNYIECNQRKFLGQPLLKYIDKLEKILEDK